MNQFLWTCCLVCLTTSLNGCAALALLMAKPLSTPSVGYRIPVEILDQCRGVDAVVPPYPLLPGSTTGDLLSQGVSCKAELTKCGNAMSSLRGLKN